MQKIFTVTSDQKRVGEKDPLVIDISLNVYNALLNETPKTKGASNNTQVFKEHNPSTLAGIASSQNHTLEMVTLKSSLELFDDICFLMLLPTKHSISMQKYKI